MKSRSPIRPLSIVLGFIGGLAMLLLLQQLGIMPVTLGAIATLAVAGLLVGVVVPLLGHSLGRWRARRRNAAAQEAVS